MVERMIKDPKETEELDKERPEVIYLRLYSLWGSTNSTVVYNARQADTDIAYVPAQRQEEPK